MNVSRRSVGKQALTLGLLAALPLVPSIAVGDFTIDWHTIDSGGAMWTTGDTYELSGTISQHDAGEMSGGSYTLSGGFWISAAPTWAEGDCDYDGDVDLDDFADLDACLSGPGGGLGAGCDCHDTDNDLDVDLDDFGRFQEAFTGTV